MKSIYSKYIKKTLLFLLLVHCSLLNFATTYYVSNAGNDSNSGLSTATPWKTLAKVSLSNFNPGDQILLKCGDTWREQMFFPSSGTSENPIIISLYGTGNKPIISTPIGTTSWTLVGNGVYSGAKFLADEYSIFWEDEKAYYRATSSACTDGIWFRSGNTLYYKPTSGIPSDHVLNYGNMNWDDNNTYFSGIHVCDRSFITISDINFKTTGFGIIGATSTAGSNGITIRNCNFENCRNGISFWTSANGNNTNMIAENNVFKHCQCAFNLFSLLDNAEGQQVSCIIRNNEIIENGTTDGTTLWKYGGDREAIGTQHLIGANIYGNYIHGGNTIGFIMWNQDGVSSYNNNFHHNRIENNGDKPPLQFSGNTNQLGFYNNIYSYNIINSIRSCDFSQGNAVNQMNYIYNNTFLGGTFLRIFATINAAVHITIKNNIFCDIEGFYFYGVGTPTKLVLSNNLYKAAIAKPSFAINGSSGKTLTNMKALGYENNSIIADPLFVSSKNYGLTNSSPAINAGTNVGLTTDYSGHSIIGSPDIGAYEFIDSENLKLTNKLCTEYKSICEGSTYNGWTKTGRYERTLISKSGADSVVTTNLTVNPKYTITETITITEGENYQGWTKPGQYIRNLNSVSGCDSVITTNLQLSINTTKQAEIENTQTIELVKGYNLISTYVSVQNPDAIALTKSLSDQGFLVKLQDEAGNSLENWGSAGGWINNLGSFKATEGYKIMVAANCNLQITGGSVTLPLDVPLKTGWNIISFPRADFVDAMNIIQPLIDEKILVKVQDELGNSIENWGIFGDWKNSIGNFVPGKAYKVKINADATLTIHENYPKSVSIQAKAEKAEHFSTTVEGNGFDHMNINLVGLHEAGISSGDELAAFDGALCVGTLKITENHLMNGSASLIASFSTNDQLKNGFTEGHSIQIALWNKLSGAKNTMDVTPLTGSLNYIKNASILVKVKSAAAVNRFEELVQIIVFPNPSHGKFTIWFSAIPVDGSRIDVLDVSGRKIASRLITSTSEEFNLTDQASGLYLVKTKIGSKEEIHKIIIN